MLIKVAVKRENNGTIVWKDPYAASIRNRLRIDQNLADLSDKAAARANLGISALLDSLRSEITGAMDAKFEALKSEINSKNAEQDNKIQELFDALSGIRSDINAAINDIKGYVDQQIQNLRGSVSDTTSGLASDILSRMEKLPVGSIVPFVGNMGSIPAGWAVCDGNNGTIDLRDWFLIGTSDSGRIGATGGEREVTLNEGQMPQHRHLDPYCDNLDDGNMEVQIRNWRNQGFDVAVDQGQSNAGSGRTDYNSPRVYTGWAGGNQPHNNMPPYKYVMFIQKVSG